MQAFKEEDKAYVLKNLSALFNPLDLLNLYLLGSQGEGCPSLQCIGVLETSPGSVVLGCQQHLETSPEDILRETAAQMARLLPPSAWGTVPPELVHFMPPLPAAHRDLPLHAPLEELLLAMTLGDDGDGDGDGSISGGGNCTQDGGLLDKQGGGGSVSSSSLSSLELGGENWRDLMTSSSEEEDGDDEIDKNRTDAE